MPSSEQEGWKTVNFFKKLKLKTLLRNCDYLLAGTVIKQQYYDSKKQTEINRLIDNFMENPGFEEALKLIDHNEMMVFYFTESCADGLYVRKTAKDAVAGPEEMQGGASEAEVRDVASPSAQTAEDQDTADMPLSNKDTQQPDSEEPMTEITVTEKSMPAESNAAAEIQAAAKHNRPAAETKAAEMKPEPASSAAVDPLADTLQEESERARRMRKLKESEEWLKQMIARAPKKSLDQEENASAGGEFPNPAVRGTAEPEPSSRQYETENERSASGEKLQYKSQARIDEAAASAEKTTPARSKKTSKRVAKKELNSAKKETAVSQIPTFISASKQQDLPLSGPAAEPSSPYGRSDRSSHASDEIGPLHAEPPVDTGPSVAAEPQPPERSIAKQSFSNVVATLNMDIHTMEKQLSDYQRQLPYRPMEEDEIRGWIRALEQAIQEFSSAVDVLEGEEG